MKEFCFSSQQIKDAVVKLHNYCETVLDDCSGYYKLEHQWNVGEHEGMEWFLHWFNQPVVSILDYISPETLLIWDDLVPLNRRLDEARDNYQRHLDRAPELILPLLSSPEQLLFSNNYIEEVFSCFNIVYFDTLDLPESTKTYTLSLSEQPQLPYEVSTIVDNF